jgi:hypothetical protein
MIPSLYAVSLPGPHSYTVKILIDVDRFEFFFLVFLFPAHIGQGLAFDNRFLHSQKKTSKDNRFVCQHLSLCIEQKKSLNLSICTDLFDGQSQSLKYESIPTKVLRL